MSIEKLFPFLQNTFLARLWASEGGNSADLGGNSAPDKSATAAPSPQPDDPFSLADDDDRLTDGAVPMKL